MQHNKLRHCKFILRLLPALGVVLYAPAVFAANVNFPVNTTISLTGSGVSFTVLANSSADSFVTNATSVVITVSAGVSSSTLVSGSADFVTSGSATMTKSCSGNTATVVITGSGTATLLPAGSPCAVATGGGSASYVYSWGGGGGGAAATTTPAVSTSSVATSTPKVATTTPAAPPLVVGPAVVPLAAPSLASLFVRGFSTFTRNLQFTARGNDVKILQIFLIHKAAGPIAKRLARFGANGRFGPLTFRALKEYQRSVGLRATGYFGPATRAYIVKNENQ